MNREDEFNNEVRACLEQLDGTTLSAVALLTGFSVDELRQFGGLDEDSDSGEEPS